MSSVLNPQYRPAAVPPPSGQALAFHRALPAYAPTPVRDLGGGVWLKDESDRFGLPAFKVLGVSWAVERALREDPESRDARGRERRQPRTGGGARRRAARSARAGVPAGPLGRRAARGDRGGGRGRGDRRRNVRGRGPPRRGGRRAHPGAIELADVGASGPAHWVIDGYATLFAELDPAFDTIFVPVGVGSLGAAAARYGAPSGTDVIAVEPDVAACLTASLRRG